MSMNRGIDKNVVYIQWNTEVKWSRSVMSDSLRPHGQLLCPWDFPGKSTGVGCHFLLQGTFPTQGLNLGLLHCRQILYWLSCQGCLWSCSVMSDSLWSHGMKPTRHLRPWNFPGRSTGVSCHFLLQGIYLTWGLNLGLPHCRQTLYPLSHQGSPAFLYMW